VRHLPYLAPHGAANMRDMVGRDRESRPLAKVSASDATTIRSRYASGSVTQATLAHEYGLAQSQVSRIVNRRQWKKAE
jgi:hypothetical protein